MESSADFVQNDVFSFFSASYFALTFTFVHVMPLDLKSTAHLCHSLTVREPESAGSHMRQQFLPFAWNRLDDDDYEDDVVVLLTVAAGKLLSSSL